MANASDPVEDHAGLFDRFAPHYHIAEIFSFGLLRKLRRGVVEGLVIPADGFIMDLMCGTGNNLGLIRERMGAGPRFLGIDVSGGMIAQASMDHASDPRARFLRSDVFRMSTPGIAADHVLCSFGLRCIRVERYRALSRLVYGSVVPGGGFSLLEFRAPRSHLLNALVRLYLATIYRLGCILVAGNAAPATELLRSLAVPVDPHLIARSFRESGFETTTMEKWGGAVVLISGRRPTSG